MGIHGMRSTCLETFGNLREDADSSESRKCERSKLQGDHIEEGWGSMAVRCDGACCASCSDESRKVRAA